MAYSRPQKALILLLILTLILSAFGDRKGPIYGSPTAYQVLEGFDFPPGILPAGVTSYLLRQDGSFEVYLSEDDCEFKIAGQYQLKYRQKITGTVQSGAIKNLNGVSVKVLFLWIGINEVDRSGDELSFYVGPLSASFGVANFEESPRCRCGFDCATAAAANAAS
ncbi:hypothetical protein ACMD2_15055 [Ananas comosus]|uniref:DUF538 domain-containing protein n=1 Tax=Ananas comosus TaxID=4615 RepID=A0A199UE73_ANACO|nr:hypothetical protein ACMD2_15055 [Ananas comosus]